MTFAIRRALAVTSVLVLTAAACGDSGADEPAATDAPAPPQAPAPTDAPAPSPTATPAHLPGNPGRVVAPGDAISVHYVGTLDGGEVFDSSRPRGQPLSFVVGSGQTIAGFDAGVQGMKLGEVIDVRIEPVDAYGEWTEERVVTVPIDQVPPGAAVGDELSSGGQAFKVLEVSDTEVRLDANHPLAGQALNFEIELVSFDN